MHNLTRFLWIAAISFSVFVSAHAESPEDASSAMQYRAKIEKLAREVISPERGWADQYAYDQQNSVGTRVLEGQIARKDHKQEGPKVRYVLFEPEQFSGSAILWLDGAEKSTLYETESNSERIKPTALTQQLIDAGHAVVVINLPRNRGSFAERVRKALSTIGVGLPFATSLKIVGSGDAGPALLVASAFLEDLPADKKRIIKEIIVDAKGTALEKNLKSNDPLFLPKANDFGGILGIAALTAPLTLTINGLEGIPELELAPLKNIYRMANAEKNLQLSTKMLDVGETIERLSKKSP